MGNDNQKKVIICLAASWKPGGRCIAGKDVSDKKSWVRPISDGEEDGIDNQQSCYSDGKLAQVLDIIEIPILKPCPKQHQKENFLVDSQKKWKKQGEVKRQDLKSLLDNPPSLWHNLDSSTNGINDRIHASQTGTISTSLYLIEAQCKIIVRTEGKEFNDPKKRVRCSFKYKNIDFVLSVTDPLVRQEYEIKPEKEYDLEKKYICVSLGLEHKDKYLYLLAATII
jgi:hypothetical protein